MSGFHFLGTTLFKNKLFRAPCIPVFPIGHQEHNSAQVRACAPAHRDLNSNTLKNIEMGKLGKVTICYQIESKELEEKEDLKTRKT